ncbi:hypothetical protein KY333_00065 [Candidatus Woesearchaeota archaeon]|nr:hypothetical protein [Candidatus Woesearchaeota archaeon]MBW2994269.1 hypothetical protein [Candidatus Woesearchaeota archaeon]
MVARYLILLVCLIAVITGCTAKEQQESKYTQIKENIFACNSAFNTWDGKTHTICYDSAGAKLFDEPYDVLSELGFSKEKSEKLEKEFKQGCFNEAKFKDLPPSIITEAILKTKLFKDKTICENIDKSTYFWKHINHTYTYSIKHTGAGGNFRGYTWSLEVKPYTTEGIDAEQYPFLTCESFSANKMHAWNLEIEKEDNILKITADNIRPTEAEDLNAEEMNNIAKNFTDCSSKYDYYRLSKENTYN